MAKVYGSSKESCPLKDSAICVTVVDEARKVPVGQVEFEIVDANKMTHKGITDAKDGTAKFDPFLKGPYTLKIQLKPDLKKAYQEPPPRTGTIGVKEEVALVKLKGIEKPQDPCFRNWIRIEPRCRSEDFSRGLEARTADPLWMLARQWQFGELQGEDAGSPIEVRVAYQSAPLTAAAAASGTLGEGADLPLETRVEREKVPWDHRLRVRAGQQFERFARTTLGADAAAVVDAYRVAFPMAVPADALSVDRQTCRFLQLMSGRAVNGELLLAASKSQLEAALPDAAKGSAAGAESVVEMVRQWFAKLYSQPPGDTSPAWSSNRLEYQFEARAAVADGTALSLSAPAYQSGDLDWHTFTVGKLPAKWPKVAQAEQSYPPVRVSFAGMPNKRFWAFEDHRVDFGGIEVGKPDLARMALMEFALLYSADWFLVPLSVPLGSVTAVRTVEVTDVFGHAHPKGKAIPRARSSGPDALQRWEMFAPADPAASGASGAEVLVVPAVLGFREHSAALEEIRFLRDEGADMVWGVEHVVLNGLGEPVSGFDAQLERRARERERDAQQPPLPSAGPVQAPAAAKKPLPAYRLATTVPDNWIPFLPADAHAAFGSLGTGPGRPSVRLCRAQMLRNETAAAPEPIPAMSRILDLDAPAPLLWMDEETVAREGAKVVLARHRARWIDGQTFVWLGRRIGMGRGEGNSGLRFDVLREAKPT